MRYRRLLLLHVIVLTAITLKAQISLTVYTNETITLNAPSSPNSFAPDLFSVTWSKFSGDNCVSLVNAQHPTVTVNILEKGYQVIKCYCRFYNKDDDPYKYVEQTTLFHLTCIDNNGGGSSGEDNPEGGESSGDTFFQTKTEENISLWCKATRDFYGKFCIVERPTYISSSYSCIPATTKGKVTIPENTSSGPIKRIERNAFHDIPGITDVVIPKTVNFVAYHVIIKCKNIKSITSLNETPPTAELDRIFDEDILYNATLYVPTQEAKKKYSVATGWKDFVTIKVIGEPDDIKVSNITLNTTSASIMVGESFQLYAKVYPNDAADKRVAWSSSSSSGNYVIADVNSEGLVTGKRAGETTITCKAKDRSGTYATCTVKVVDKNSEFKAKNSNGVEMLFHIVSECNKTCALGGKTSLNACIDKTTSGQIVIPSEIEGYTVIEINSAAFKDCANIESITIPPTITKIRDRAFINCTSLKEIKGLNNIDYVEPYAFINTPWYESLSDGPVYIGSAFYTYKGEMPVHTTLKIKEGTKTICPQAFSQSSTETAYKRYPGLESFVIPSSVCLIGYDNAIWHEESGYYSQGNPELFDCPNLQSIVIDDENEYYHSPDNCNAIIEKNTGIMLAASNKTVIASFARAIAPKAFDGLEGITTLTIPDNIEVFGGISKCKNLESLYFGKGVKVIRTSYSNPKLKSIAVDADNNNYDSRNDCNAVIQKTTSTLIIGCTSTIIPASVEVINNFAFNGNGSELDIPSIKIPDNVRKICNSAFSDLNKVRTVVIGKGVNEIENYAFGGYFINLMEIYSLNENPTDIAENAFMSETYKKGTLYVPVGSKSKYQNTTGWKNFKNIVEGEPIDNSTTEVIWENDGSHGIVNWNSDYRFACEENKDGNETYVIPINVWRKMKTTTFYLDLQATNPLIRVTTGSHSVSYPANYIGPGDELLTDKGNGMWTFKIDLSSAPYLLDVIDEQHMLLYGEGYTPLKLYFLGTTDIQGIKVMENLNNDVFSISGQRLAMPKKGINIINGKKVVVR